MRTEPHRPTLGSKLDRKRLQKSIRKMRKYARQIRTEDQLRAIIGNCEPALRRAVLAEFEKHVPFEVSDELLNACLHGKMPKPPSL